MGEREVLLRLLKERRSVRGFSSSPVPREGIMKILEAAIWAPSAGNVQPWYFYVVTSPEKKESLARAAYGQRFIAEAPVCVVVCAEPERSYYHYGNRGRNLYCYQDTAAACQNILLAATALGLGACWVGAFDEEKTCRYLNIPRGRRPVALVPIGYPAEQGLSRPGRKSLQQVVEFVED